MAMIRKRWSTPGCWPSWCTQYDVEQFYYEEAALPRRHEYGEWVELFTDDTHYFMPIRRTRSKRELDKEFTKPGEMAFFDDERDARRAGAEVPARDVLGRRPALTDAAHGHNVRVVDTVARSWTSSPTSCSTGPD